MSMTKEEFNRAFPVKSAGRLDSEKFNVWMARVDALIEKSTGLSSMDLPDYCYRDAFDDGASPGSAAKAAIRAAKEF